MKWIIFSLVFLILTASTSLAKGLEINQIDVRVNYDEAYVYRLEQLEHFTRVNYASVPVSNNSKINVEVLPGSNVTFTVRVQNTFQGKEPSIRKVIVKIRIEEADDGSDLEEESADFELEPGDDNRVDVKFPIPLDVDSGTFSTIIEAEGQDKNGTSYNTQLKLKLELKKQLHDIRITDVSLNPSIMECSRKAKLTAEITNAGSNNENEVALEFKSANLGVNSFDKDIFLDASNDASIDEKQHTKILNIEIPPFFKSGKYPIYINLYWKNFVMFDQKIANLVVKDCGISSTTKSSTTKETKLQQPKQETGEKEAVILIQPKETKNNLGQEFITATRESSVFNSPVFLSMFLVAFVITVFAIIAVFAFLRRSKV